MTVVDSAGRAGRRTDDLGFPREAEISAFPEKQRADLYLSTALLDYTANRRRVPPSFLIRSTRFFSLVRAKPTSSPRPRFLSPARLL